MPEHGRGTGAGEGTRPTIQRLVGVYDADGSRRGEIAYWVGARLGRAHCALCDITHGTFRERSEWRECRAGLPVPFETYHRDDQPDDVRQATQGRVPNVVAVTDRGIVVLLGPDGLAACGGSVDDLAQAIDDAVVAAALAWQ
jgi:hypothetical protein